MADYAYAFKAPPQYYISPSSSSSNPNLSTNGSNTGTSNTNNPIAPPTALLWTDLEPWMDAEYARQVCALMRWDAGVLVPPPSTNGFSSNAASGPNATHPNNAGYAVLSFASAGAAAAALAQVGGCRLSSLVFVFVFVLVWRAWKRAPSLGEDACQAHASAGPCLERIYRAFGCLEPTARRTGPCEMFSA
jgi:hypothetical protein